MTIKINKIYNENCIETIKRIPDNFIDMVLTSPPYDNLRDYKGYTFEFKPIANGLYRIIKHGGVIVWVVGDATINGSETGTSFKQALYFKEIGFKLHDTMIYQKTGIAFPDFTRYYQNFEYMFIFCKGKLNTFNPIKDRFNISNGQKIRSVERRRDGTTRKKSGCGNIINKYGVRYNIWQYPNCGKERSLHPAVFPEKLANDHIISWSNKYSLIYDPFVGSGTTAIMAIKNNRSFIGSEISKEYYTIANERINSSAFNTEMFE